MYLRKVIITSKLQRHVRNSTRCHYGPCFDGIEISNNHIKEYNMGIVGSAIGGALGLGASIFGGITASKAMKEMKQNIEKQRRKNEELYNRRYNEDATQRADAQRILTITQENIRKRNRQAAGTQAVMGGSDESVAATKAANNEALADAASQIVVNGEARKDQIEANYLQRDAELQNQLDNLEQAKAQNIANAVNGVAQAGSAMASTF